MRFWLVKKNRARAALILGCVLALVLALVLAVWSGAGPGLPPAAQDPAGVPAGTVAGDQPPAEEEAAPGAVAVAGAAVGDSPAQEYYVECRLERERARGKQVELLRAIVADPQSGSEARQNAQARLLEISLELEREVNVENILRAKGLSDAAVFFQNEMVTVVAPHPMAPEQSATVVNLVARATGMLPENILIITRED